jgi:hypothetical protein
MESMIDRQDADAVEFLERCHDALRQHTGGNPGPYLDLWSQAEDVSLMGGVGGHQVGIAAVSDLLTAAAKTLNYTTGTQKTSLPASAIRLASPSSSSGSRGK